MRSAGLAFADLRKVETHEHAPIEAVEHIVSAMPDAPAIEHTATKAFYSATNDRITMPPRNLFVSAEDYGSTLLHELTRYADVTVPAPARQDASSVVRTQGRDVSICDA